MDDHDQSMRRAVNIYRRLLLLYPRSHRREYGALMAQLFQDQCRDLPAREDGSRRGLARLWGKTLLDLVCTAFYEHLSNQIHRMKNMPPKTLSLVLFIVSTFAALLSIKLTVLHASQGLVVGLLCFCAAALLVRAICEWLRPGAELVKSLVWAAAIAVIYSLVMPVFAKLHLIPNPALTPLLMAAILSNSFVPLGRAAHRIIARRG